MKRSEIRDRPRRLHDPSRIALPSIRATVAYLSGTIGGDCPLSGGNSVMSSPRSRATAYVVSSSTGSIGKRRLRQRAGWLFQIL
jgi:hypothetical protein